MSNTGSQKHRRKKISHLFSKIIVVYCILMCSVMSVWAMYLATRYNFLCTGVLGVVMGVFGGELLFLCLKRIACEKSNPKNGGSANSDTDCD